MLPADGRRQLGAQRAHDVLRLLRAVLPDVLLQQHGRVDAPGACEPASASAISKTTCLLETGSFCELGLLHLLAVRDSNY